MTIRSLLWSAALASAVLVANRAGAQAATTICKDGSTSATSGRGACSGHGGVDAKATAAAEKKAKDAAKAAKPTKGADQVTCTDGTMSKPGRGACSGHGGIKAANSTPSTPAPAATAAPAPKNTASATTGGSGGADDNNPSGAIAKCKDGLYSHAAHRQGACSRHGGVAQWMGK